MRAIKFLGANQIALTEAEEPAIKEGLAKIKIAYAGICGSDINIYGGTHPRAKAGLIMGHEFAGTLINDVGAFKKGDRVAVYPLISCGKCTPCINGNKHVCNTLGLYGIDKDGGFADYTVVPEDTLVKLPDSVSLNQRRFPVQSCLGRNRRLSSRLYRWLGELCGVLAASLLHRKDRPNCNLDTMPGHPESPGRSC